MTTQSMRRAAPMPPVGWRAQAERGASWAMRMTAALARRAGRGPSRAFLLPGLAYFHLTAGAARRASHAFYRRLLGRVPKGAFFRQLRAFADCTLDRMYFLRGELDPFEISHLGHEHLRRLHDEGRGALLVGAHLGSFEAMRGMAGRRSLQIWSAVDVTVARRIEATLAAVGGPPPNIVPLRAGDPSSVLDIADRIERGHLVAILADRVDVHEPAVRVPFLGALARFPAGPWRIAAALGCPVYLTFGLYTPPNRYRLFCEPFADRIVVGSRRRPGPTVEEHAARFARRLEHYVRLAPYNWFNFFDPWSEP
ncbi:MAG: acyltransferase [Deltaproteobacteria bacterium]|nr:MAG: acyltransferase [Deltaproteobacteria bacterium]